MLPKPGSPHCCVEYFRVFAVALLSKNGTCWFLIRPREPENIGDPQNFILLTMPFDLPAISATQIASKAETMKYKLDTKTKLGADK